ncbi:MAG: hypothetical protein WC975_11195 [Phycisphaerae bacterium]
MTTKRITSCDRKGAGNEGLFRASILLETILALLFVVLTVGVVAGLFTTSLSKNRQAQCRTRANLLAQNILAEMQLGLLDITESGEGDFNGRPDKFSWKVELEPTAVQELQRLKITINYNDPVDGFAYTIFRLFSPSLNLSPEKIKEIASDPVKRRAMSNGSPELEKLFELVSSMGVSDKFVETLLRGGAPALQSIITKMTTGKLSLNDLMGTAANTETDNSTFALLGQTDQMRNILIPWTSWETDEIGEAPVSETTLASTVQPGNNQPSTQPAPGTGPVAAAQPGATPNDARNQVMTRDEAIQRMQEMLRRLANQQK